MSYDSQSATGYNTSAPADDGSTTEANKVKWSTIKTKLGDPTKNLADAINTANVAAWADLASTTSADEGDALIGVLRTASNAVATTQHAWHEWQKISAFDFMTAAEIADVVAGTEAVDVTTAITNMFALGSGYHYHFPKGTYSVTDGFDIPTQCKISGDGVGSIIKASSSWAPSVPTITAGTYTPTLSYTPLLYNSSPISFWDISDIYLNGNNEDCYGLWLHENFWGSMRNVLIANCNQRGYTNIRGQAVTHINFSVNNCNDSVVTYDNTGFIFIGCGWEYISGTWAYDQRQPNGFSKGGVTIEDCWFESSAGNAPSAGFLKMSGRRNKVNGHFAFHTTATTEEMLRLNDSSDSTRSVDGITMQSANCVGGEFTVNNSSGQMLINCTANSSHNNVDGGFTASLVTDNGAGNSFQYESLSTPVKHFTGRFQVRYGDTGSGIPVAAASYVIDADHNSGTPEIRMLGNAGHKLSLNGADLRLTGNANLELSASGATGRIESLVPHQMAVKSDATRGAASDYPYTVIFNTTDGNLNISDGVNWILPDGTTT